MKVLITGGNGFIGIKLVKALLKKNYEVRVFDNLSKGKNRLPDEVEFIQGDLRNKEDIDKATKDVDYVFHKAAVAINRSLEFPEESLDINLKGSFNVFESCLKNKVKKVIFSSSASVYGNPEKLPVNEDDKKNPVTPYCISKLASEYLLKFFSEQGLNYIVLRYFNVYGEGQNLDAFYTSVVDKFVEKVLNNESPEIHGSGDQSMDMVHVNDIIKADIKAMESDVVNEVFNVGSGKQTTVKELAEEILRLLDKKLEVKYVKRDVIASRRQADVSKIKKMLDWETEVSVEDGLKEIIDIYKNENI
ncbi:UDP-glucose 4-epimerase [archaeon]|nr:UDP-glucose 4-epimerase [archaeon]|tara:strand:+ start:585 stop:1496 length:912 start_codon:yes stop_codon:yes gene_type:complete